MPHRLSSIRQYWRRFANSLWGWLYGILPTYIVDSIRHFTPSNDFITYHYLYFLSTTLIASAILWGSAEPNRSLRFIDSYYLAVSAMTLAGMNTVNLSTLTTFQQVVLFILTLLGSAIWVSIFVVHVRRKALKAALEKVEQTGEKDDERLTLHQANTGAIHVLNDFHPLHDQEQQIENTSSSEGALPDRDLHGSNAPARPLDLADSSSAYLKRITSNDQNQRLTFAPDPLREVTTTSGLILRTGTELSTNTMRRRRTSTQDATTRLPYLSFAPTINRNSQFSNLSPGQQLELSNVEYRALTLLAWLVPLYFVLVQLIASIALGIYISLRRPEVGRGIVGGQGEANAYTNSWWLSIFNVISAFNNNGMSLVDANATIFSGDWFVLGIMAFLIAAGNTAYPILLRFSVWSLKKAVEVLIYLSSSRGQHASWLAQKIRKYPLHQFLHTINFLLDHPRRCYTNMFKRRQTWWLLAALVSLNGFDWAMFNILNINNPEISSLTVSEKLIDGLFQAFAVRCGGFYVVAIPGLAISLLVLYTVMMYISAYPIAIAIRNSNVYEERSLGIYVPEDDDDGESDDEEPNSSNEQLTRVNTSKSGKSLRLQNKLKKPGSYFVRHQIRAQLAHDVWWLAVAVFIIMIVEGSQFKNDPINFSVFNVIFECVSAYGTVGISIGYPNVDYSFSGVWHTLSKLVLCAVMLRGRHRGLPVAIDRAVQLPGQKVPLTHKEEVDAGVKVRNSVLPVAEQRG